MSIILPNELISEISRYLGVLDTEVMRLTCWSVRYLVRSQVVNCELDARQIREIIESGVHQLFNRTRQKKYEFAINKMIHNHEYVTVYIINGHNIVRNREYDTICKVLGGDRRDRYCRDDEYSLCQACRYYAYYPYIVQCRTCGFSICEYCLKLCYDKLYRDVCDTYQCTYCIHNLKNHKII